MIDFEIDMIRRVWIDDAANLKLDRNRSEPYKSRLQKARELTKNLVNPLIQTIDTNLSKVQMCKKELALVQEVALEGDAGEGRKLR